MVVGICVGFCRKHLYVLISCFTFALHNAETQSLMMNQNFKLQYSKMNIVACGMVT